MKRYEEYMDGIQAPDTLRQRLKELEAPAKRPVPWKRYGGMAAALALVCGLGAWGLGRSGGWEELIVSFRPAAALPEIEVVDEPDRPDIALVEPGDVAEPGEKVLGGYDVTYGSGPAAMVSHYVLPYIEYGEVDADTEAAELDWDVPPGATRRDLTEDEIVRLMGGQDVVDAHLDWGEYELTGWAAWYEDGSFWGAYIDGLLIYYGGPANQFEFAVTAGALPPTCFGHPDSVTQEVRGLTLDACRYHTPTAISVPAGTDAPEMTDLVVSFMKGEYGYRFEMSSLRESEAEETVSRLVRQIADRGIDLSLLGGTNDDTFRGSDWCGDPAGDVVPEFVPNYDPTYEDGVISTEPYDPEGTGEICGLPLAPSVSPESPPVLKVWVQLGSGSLESNSCSYTWRIGDTASVVACGAHPLQYQYDYGRVTAEGTVTLDFSDLPDQVSAVCWPYSAWGDTSAASQPAQVDRDERGQSYELTLEDGDWIYEVEAVWDDRGTASYVFYLEKK